MTAPTAPQRMFELKSACLSFTTVASELPARWRSSHQQTIVRQSSLGCSGRWAKRIARTTEPPHMPSADPKDERKRLNMLA